MSQKCRYALRAIFELAVRNTSDPVKTQDIACAQSIPARFLEVILVELKHGGFVESRRGNDGGYILARAVDDLTVGEVIEFLEGTVPTRRRSYKSRADQPFAEMWEKVSTSIAAIYNQTTFADLVQQELRRRGSYVPNYAI